MTVCCCCCCCCCCLCCVLLLLLLLLCCAWFCGYCCNWCTWWCVCPRWFTGTGTVTGTGCGDWLSCCREDVFSIETTLYALFIWNCAGWFVVALCSCCCARGCCSCCCFICTCTWEAYFLDFLFVSNIYNKLQKVVHILVWLFCFWLRATMRKQNTWTNITKRRNKVKQTKPQLTWHILN